jgi:hypothetical protein
VFVRIIGIYLLGILCVGPILQMNGEVTHLFWGVAIAQNHLQNHIAVAGMLFPIVMDEAGR